jgi:hypothetical protein
MRLRVQNIGSADLTGATLSDVLHANFTYVGNESYYFMNAYHPPCGSGSIPSGATAWTGVTTSHSGNNLNWNLPDIDSDCQLFFTGYCGTYGTSTLPYYFIEFDVKVSETAMPGVTPNQYQISGGNLGNAVYSNTTHILVEAFFGQEVTKQFSPNSGSTWLSTGQVPAGAPVRYRLNWKNTSTVPAKLYKMADLVGRDNGTADVRIFNRTVSRGSMFDLTYTGSYQSTSLSSGSAAPPAIDYTSTVNPCLPDLAVTTSCTAATWASSPVTRNILWTYGSATVLPGVTLRQDFDVAIPSTTSAGLSVCNDFGAKGQADFLLNSTTPTVVDLPPVASPVVCLTVNKENLCNCDSVHFEPNEPCCVRIHSACAVKEVRVNSTNGVLDDVVWNCTTPVPSGYQGQHTYNFMTAPCAIDMMVCFDATTNAGFVTADLVVILEDSTECKKTVNLKCNTDVECCADVDFTLANRWNHSWPYFSLLWRNGIFHIENEMEITSTICYVEITANPPFNFNQGHCYVDNVLQPASTWNITRIPATGNLTDTEVDDIQFNMTASNYNGIITICVFKCDGTMCCFSFDWMTIHPPVPVDISELEIDTELFALRVKPVVTNDIPEEVKWVSFGLNKEEGPAREGPSFFAISGSLQTGDVLGKEVAACENTYMSPANAFFMLKEAVPVRSLGAFNLVCSKLPDEMYCTLYGVKGKILAEGAFKTGKGTEVLTGLLDEQDHPLRPDLLEFLNLYPNPADDTFHISYAIGTNTAVDIQVINSSGQIVLNAQTASTLPGIHEQDIDATALAAGTYTVRIIAQGKILTRQLVVN